MLLTKEQLIKYNVIMDPTKGSDEEYTPIKNDNANWFPTGYSLRMDAKFNHLIDMRDDFFNISKFKSNIKEKIEQKKKNEILLIPRYACVLVGTYEWINVPDNVFGRWGLKVRYILKGLYFQAGPQIKPGYRGRLFGLLFNLTGQDKEIPLFEGKDNEEEKKVWDIDFQTVKDEIKLRENSSGLEPKLEMVEFIKIEPNELGQAGFNQIIDRQDQFIDKLEKESKSRNLFIMVLVPLIISVIFAGLIGWLTILWSDYLTEAKIDFYLEKKLLDFSDQLQFPDDKK